MCFFFSLNIFNFLNKSLVGLKELMSLVVFLILVFFFFISMSSLFLLYKKNPVRGEK